MLAEANTELGHAVRRAEQYETEVFVQNLRDMSSEHIFTFLFFF